MLGENEGHHAIFHAEKHGKRPEYTEKVKNVFFSWHPGGGDVMFKNILRNKCLIKM